VWCLHNNAMFDVAAESDNNDKNNILYRSCLEESLGPRESVGMIIIINSRRRSSVAAADFVRGSDFKRRRYL